MTNPQTGAHTHPGSGEPETNPGLVRLLKAVVIGLGVAIVLGLGAVAIRIVQLAQGPITQSPQPATAATAQPAVAGNAAAAFETRLELPAGAVVKSIDLDGNRLAAHYGSPSGDGMTIIDLETGRVVARVRIAPGGP